MTTQTGLAARLDRFFGLTERGTNVRTEVLAGATTFMTMAYIVFVNPAILGKVTDSAGTQLAFPALLTSTALVAAVMTLAMGLFANLPLALAAGMGLNSVVAFQLVAGMKLTWPQAMGVIVAEGLVIAALVATGLRQAIVRAVPVSMKRAIGIGIGLFLAIIGFVDAGFVSRNAADPVPVTLGTAGHLRGFPVLLFVLTLLFTGWLVLRNVKGALLIGIVSSTVLAVAVKALLRRRGRVQALGGGPPRLAGRGARLLAARPVRLRLRRRRSGRPPRRSPSSRSCSPTSSTRSGPWWRSGRRRSTSTPRATTRAPAPSCSIDSLAAVAGGAAGASSATTYIESASGAAAGGRTGLTSVVTALLFAACLFISPLAGLVPAAGHRRGARARRLLHDARRGEPALGRRHRGHPGLPRPHGDALHLQHHERHRRGLHRLRRC